VAASPLAITDWCASKGDPATRNVSLIHASLLSLPLSSAASPPPSQDGCTPLQFAAEYGFLGIMDKLMHMGADIEAREGQVPSFVPNKWPLNISVCGWGAAHSLTPAAA
jgi:hypothetical protein